MLFFIHTCAFFFVNCRYIYLIQIWILVLNHFICYVDQNLKTELLIYASSLSMIMSIQILQRLFLFESKSGDGNYLSLFFIEAYNIQKTNFSLVLQPCSLSVTMHTEMFSMLNLNNDKIQE